MSNTLKGGTAVSGPEIERKFLVRWLPERLGRRRHYDILQAYLKNTDKEEVRVRSADGKFYLTAKRGSGLKRHEETKTISAEDFAAKLRHARGRLIGKTRYIVPYKGRAVELDVYRGGLKGLVVAEVEFATVAQSRAFMPPPWLGREVTYDKRYKNKELSRRGAPQSTAIRPRTSRKQATYDLKRGVRAAVSEIRAMLKTSDTPVLVGLAGGSASGKTSMVSRLLKDALGPSAMILQMDDYFRNKGFIKRLPSRNGYLNFDTPRAIKLDLFAAHLRELRANKPITKPVFDFALVESPTFETVRPARVIIAEGLFTLVKPLVDLYDLTIFVDASLQGQMLRRLLRDTGRSKIYPASSDVLGLFVNVAAYGHRRYVERTKRCADIVIKNDFDPRKEAARIGNYTVQAKFMGDVPEGRLLSMGATKIGTFSHIDEYYITPQMAKGRSGEQLRIRREGDHTTFCYKGPSTGRGSSRRPKLEFPLEGDNSEIKKFLLSISKGNIIRVDKERTVYTMDGITVNVDRNVTKTEAGGKRRLSSFVEVKYGDGPGMRERASGLIGRLRLSNSINMSYADM